MTRPIEAIAGDGAFSAASSSSSGMSISACISWVALAMRKRPPEIRIRSCQENGQAQQRGQRKQQRNAKDQRQPEADAAGDFGTAGVETPHQDRNEDDVVDPEHDLEGSQAC